MNPRLEGVVTLEFVRAGVAQASKKPYVVMANGRKEVFLDLPPKSSFDFSAFEEGDIIDVKVAVLVGSDRAKLLEVISQ